MMSQNGILKPLQSVSSWKISENDPIGYNLCRNGITIGLVPAVDGCVA